MLWQALIFLAISQPFKVGLGKGSRSEHPLPDCQGSHDVSWLHSDREKDCGLKIPLTSIAKFQLEKSSPLTSRTIFQLEKSSPVTSRTKKIFAFPKVV